MNALLDAYTDAQVAPILNERGLRMGAGAAFDAVSVQPASRVPRPAGCLPGLVQGQADAYTNDGIQLLASKPMWVVNTRTQDNLETKHYE